MEALPNPASWVKMPREMPTRTQVKNPTPLPAAPAMPPEENACVKI